jgi:hypothetical protein
MIELALTDALHRIGLVSQSGPRAFSLDQWSNEVPESATEGAEYLALMTHDEFRAGGFRRMPAVPSDADEPGPATAPSPAIKPLDDRLPDHDDDDEEDEDDPPEAWKKGRRGDD